MLILLKINQFSSTQPRAEPINLFDRRSLLFGLAQVKGQMSMFGPKWNIKIGLARSLKLCLCLIILQILHKDKRGETNT